MPRILLLTPEFPPHSTGGLGTHLSTLAAGLADAGWTVDVVAPCGPERPADHEAYELFGARVHRVGASERTRALHPSSLKAKTSYAADMREHALAVASEPRGRVDLVHVHDWFLGSLGRELKDALSVPLVLTVHLLYGPVFPMWGQRLGAEIGAAEGDACRSADLVVTVSRAMAELVCSSYAVAPERVVAVHNGLDEEAIAAFSAPRHVADGAAPLVVFAGRITRQKGVVPLLRSAALVLERVPEARWVLAGPVVDPLRDRRDLGSEIRDLLASDARLAAAVTLAGSMPREALAQLYREAALAVVPSVYEPFGYVALEAMCAGLPVVASRVGGLPEIVDDGVTGVLVPTEEIDGGERAPSISALAEAQLRVLEDRAWGRALGEAGRARAMEHFPPGKMVEETLSAYRKLLAPCSTDR
jgi:glycosyltransferase involved in cell wall biosynthesis